MINLPKLETVLAIILGVTRKSLEARNASQMPIVYNRQIL